MIRDGKWKSSRGKTAIGAALLLIVGAAGGAGAVQAARPTVEMAPTVRTPIARLAATSGIVTVKGRVAEVYGDRFVVQDGSGRAMVAAGRDAQGSVKAGQAITVQGRFDEGQLRASYLVDPDGGVAAVGPAGPRPGRPGGPGPHEVGPRTPGHDGPPPPPPGGLVPPPPGADAPPPPPPGCAPAPDAPRGPGAVPPPRPGDAPAPGAGVAPPPPPLDR
ncbi:hypothetical protein F1C10_10895 [Sphingomonas sp. NBWT7]|uniref:hypothetical protein n=1 Tax=Sphingomonas sp. NBWT7 TaxID=2596913 RepID=UPI00162A87C0|nr:hypothetical protein [Sphingomonas sp. NBWT7]QNE32400.1 hypothetical protein F1C10_10895 [Sphingomonas sp. NBWT7]